nr:MAG TPA: Head Tail Connector Protein [Caudoviricetes sp.]
MAYITYDEYISIYGICPITEEQFPVYANIASDLIDSATQFRIEEWGGISALSPSLQKLVKKACAAQVQYFCELGIDTVMTGQTGQGFTVGKVSVNGGAIANSAMTAGQLMISPMVRILLEQTPLMERRVAVCYDRYRVFY